MALYPLISNFQHDFVLQLLAVDTENTMDEVAAAAAHHSVGRRVAPQPGKVIRVRRQGDSAFIPRETKLADAGIKPMECVEFIFTDPS
jgi:toluene monooxygenase system protein B